ncbi:MAG: AgmX/PglI C-terminal domain-containing protein [Kofleriaceae bacterium]|nr:AgmX/PglI C-terminal domain-containing protein [Kofleriaceae bacterium]
MTEANSSGDPAFEMVGISSGIAKVRVHPSMSASLLNESGVISVVDLCKAGRAQQDTQGWVELCLEEGSTLSVVDGERRYHMSWTNRSKQKAVSAVWKWDSNFSAYVGASAVLALVFGLLVDAIPPESHTFDSDAFASNRRILSLKVIPTEPPLAEEMDEGDTGGESNEEAEAASTAGAKGTTGIETATNTRASMAIKRRSDTPSMSREQMRAVASHSGILGVSGSSQIFANLNSNLDFASGDAFADLYGGLDGGPAGHQVGTLTGSWGSDVHSISDTWGTTTKVSGRIPTLSYNTNGKCNTPGECRGTTGNVKLRKHEVKGPILTLGPPKSSPGIDKAIIRRHIRRKLTRIRFCYEERLVSSPSLSGTLVTSFTINANGAVLGAKSKGIGNKQMESCVSQVISSIQFPQVESAGLVNVQYPFTFRPAGE